MKISTKTKASTFLEPAPKKYSSVNEFVAAKTKDALNNLKKVDLSILKK